jgi:hypothetical protein
MSIIIDLCNLSTVLLEHLKQQNYCPPSFPIWHLKALLCSNITDMTILQDNSMIRTPTRRAG